MRLHVQNSILSFSFISTIVLTLISFSPAYAADHGDTPLLQDAGRHDARITDFFAFTRGNNLVMVMDVDPTIPTDVSKYVFPTDVSYQFMIDNDSEVSFDDLSALATYGGTIVNPDLVKEELSIGIQFNKRGRPRLTLNGLLPKPIITGHWGSGRANSFVFVFGDNFDAGKTKISVSGIDAPIAQVLDETLLIFKLPAGVISGPLDVTTPSGSITDTTFGAPLNGLEVTGVWPSAGPAGSFMFVFGAGFVSQSTHVSIDNVDAPFTLVLDDKLLVSMVPSAATSGPIGVDVTTKTTSNSALSSSDYNVQGKGQHLYHLDNNQKLGFFAGLRDDPFIRAPRVGRNIAAIVLEFPLDFVRNAAQSTLLTWVTTDVANIDGNFEEFSGRALRSQFPENIEMNTLHPSEHFALLGVPTDVAIFDTSLSAGFPNGRELIDDVVDLVGDMRVLSSDSPYPATNDVPFLTEFPYLAAPH